MTTNIILLVKDRYALTRQCLESLFANTKDFNLCAVDDGSEDPRVKKLLANYALLENCTVVTVANSRHTTAKMRNLGVYWSEHRFGRGDWLYLADNDTWFAPKWLDTLTERATLSEKFEFRLWGGQIHPYHHPSGEPLEYQSVQSGGFSPDAPVKTGEAVVLLNQYGVLDGPSQLMRWETWDKYGPLVESGGEGPCQGEDCLFCEAIIKDGGRIGVPKEFVVEHTGLTNSKGEPAPGYDIRVKNKRAGVIYQ